MPEAPALQDAYLAWDRGDYPEAVRGYLEVLRGGEGLAHLEEIALLTGELFKVTEITTDGRGVARASVKRVRNSTRPRCGADRSRRACSENCAPSANRSFK